MCINLTNSAFIIKHTDILIRSISFNKTIYLCTKYYSCNNTLNILRNINPFSQEVFLPNISVILTESGYKRSVVQEHRYDRERVREWVLHVCLIPLAGGNNRDPIPGLH